MSEGPAGGDWGWGVWLLLAVVLMNLAAIPVWLLLNNLRRAHDTNGARVRAFLRRFDEEAPGAPSAESLSLIRSQFTRAEARGPLWGRRDMTLALLGVIQAEEQGQDAGD
jgi:hypothetical protein